jgi:hypothetical protein
MIAPTTNHALHSCNLCEDGETVSLWISASDGTLLAITLSLSELLKTAAVIEAANDATAHTLH